MVVSVAGTVVQHKGKGAIRQDRPKTEGSVRWTPVPEFAAVVLKRRALGVPSGRTIFANRRCGPLSPYNVRRTFREFLAEAGLGDSGISLRWYRRTGATVIARGMGSDAAAASLGHTIDRHHRRPLHRTRPHDRPNPRRPLGAQPAPDRGG